MTTKTLDYGEQNVGYTAEGDYVTAIGSVLAQNNLYSFSPISGSPGSIHRAEVEFSNYDLFCIEDAILDFTGVNSDGVVFPTFQNVFLLLNEIKVILNNQELIFLKNPEEIFLSVANSLRKYSEDEQYAFLMSCRSELGKTHNGETIPLSGSRQFHLPLLSFLFPQIKQYNTVGDGLNKLVVELRFVPNFNSPSLNSRFVLSNTVNNSYGNNITFTNISLRLKLKMYGDVKLYNKVPSVNKLMLFHKYEVKSYVTNWTGSETLKIPLNTEFSRHSMVTGVYFYLVGGTGLIPTNYNDTDGGGKVISDYRVGWELKYKTKSVIKYDTNTDQIKRIDYINNTWKDRNGFYPSTNLHDANNGLALYWLPMTFVDLQNVKVNEPYMEKVIAGVSNSSSDFEITFFSLFNFGSNVTAYVALEYIEIANISKDGRLNVIKA